MISPPKPKRKKREKGARVTSIPHSQLFKSVNLVTPLNDRITHNRYGVSEKLEAVSSRRVRASFL